MDIYQAITNTMQNPPSNEVDAQALLSKYPAPVQAQLINSIYLGRDHLHSTAMREDVDWTCAATDHVAPADYAQILYEKASAGASTTYLEKLLTCSKASGYDLKQM